MEKAWAQLIHLRAHISHQIVNFELWNFHLHVNHHNVISSSTLCECSEKLQHGNNSSIQTNKENYISFTFTTNTNKNTNTRGNNLHFIFWQIGHYPLYNTTISLSKYNITERRQRCDQGTNGDSKSKFQIIEKTLLAIVTKSSEIKMILSTRKKWRESSKSFRLIESPRDVLIKSW